MARGYILGLAAGGSGTSKKEVETLKTKIQLFKHYADLMRSTANATLVSKFDDAAVAVFDSDCRDVDKRYLYIYATKKVLWLG